MRNGRVTLVTAVACAVLVAGCAGTTAHGQSRAAGADAQRRSAPARAARPLPSWWTYHRTASRSGHVRTGPRAPLRRRWSRGLAGQVYGEPLVVGSTLIVATERNYVYGLDARTGALRWRTPELGRPQPMSGLPCGDIDPLGITGTPAYDPATGSVFVAAESVGGDHTLWALSAATGARRWHRSLDTQPRRNRRAEQERAALLVTHGRVLVSFGGLAGDCDNYVGYVVSNPTTGRGPSHSYAVPTPREAGMWATPGPVAGYGNVYVAAGNGGRLGGRWDRSDSVTELTPVGLRRVSAFAPASWRADNRQDLDLGSSSPVMVPAVHRIVIAGKRGTVYLLRPRLHGVGSAVRRLHGCEAFGGAAVVGRTVLMGCKRDQYEIRALRVGRRSLRWRWRRPGVYASPVVAGRRVYAADQRSGDLVVLGLRHGRVLGRHHVGPMPHFPSEVVSGRWVFVPSLRGVTAFRGR